MSQNEAYTTILVNMEFNDGDIEHTLYKVRESELSAVQNAFQNAYHRWVRHEDDEKTIEDYLEEEMTKDGLFFEIVDYHTVNFRMDIGY